MNFVEKCFHHQLFSYSWIHTQPLKFNALWSVIFSYFHKIIKYTGIFCAGNNSEPSRATLSTPLLPYLLINNVFKGPAHIVYCITLNLNISASRQNTKHLIGNFGAIHVVIVHAKFKASSFTGVGGEWDDRRTCDIMPDPYTNFPLCLGRDYFFLTGPITFIFRAEINFSRLSVVHFWATWANQCEPMDDAIKGMAEEEQGITIDY